MLCLKKKILNKNLKKTVTSPKVKKQKELFKQKTRKKNVMFPKVNNILLY